ncbi:type I-F CRISPR-associated protein Csy2 [Legionella septentrionalis]|uniref:type I-F CRISPR-associated protein Csy2 n=1 Tax=Legionella septentrionalis TaxID=2498109 RepID=UPI000F8EA7D1|nr:type I-F CRISPR-associated protein Csy2 [Legionella septentrionalis]RUQ97051.1 type I-F CRISPR-associated protein Csy2 [Legionella septentrionalis]
MKSLLLIEKIEVENANAIAGLTYGFPAVSSFLGFTHALSRQLQKDFDLTLNESAIICHNHQVHCLSINGWNDQNFALTRNPLTKEAKTASFNEEGRMHLTISLLMPCSFTYDDLDKAMNAEAETLFPMYIHQKISMLKLAGGLITKGRVRFIELDEDPIKAQKQKRRLRYQLLPGFVLVERAALLEKHWQDMKNLAEQTTIVDAWLDFFALNYECHIDEENSWHLIPRQPGWFVPLCNGFRAISPLYEKQKVAKARNHEIPFQFVEPVHTIGEWISPHRVETLNSLFWRYEYSPDWYLCRNDFERIETLGDQSESGTH